MNRILLLSLVAVVASANSALAQVSASVRMAFFSPTRVLEASTEGKALASKISSVEAERTKAIQERNTKLAEMERTLQQGTSVLSEAALGARTKELEKFRLDTQRFIEDAQQELMGVRRDAESAFLVKLRPAVERVVKDNAIQLLFNFDSGVLAWGDPALDVTNQVIGLLEKGDPAK